jgi:DnaD/phage-associated family protein
VSIKIISAVFNAEFSDLKDAAGNVTKASTVTLVLLALAYHANDNGEGAYPSLTTMACKTKMTRQGIIKTFDALKYNGIITFERVSKLRTNSYKINTEAFPGTSNESQPDLPVPVNPVDQDSQPDLPAPVNPVDQDSQPRLPVPVNPVDQGSQSHLPPVNPVDQGSQPRLPVPVNPVDLNRPLTVLKPNNDEEEEERAKKLRELYFANFGTVPPLLLETFRKAARRFTNSDWYEPAFQIAVGNGARSWRYVETILEDWLVNGFGHKPARASPKRRGARDRSDPTTLLLEYIRNGG